MSQKVVKNKNIAKPASTKKADIKKGERGNQWIWYALGLVLFATLIIYFQAIRFELLRIWDDQVYVTENSHIQSLGWENIKLIFSNYYVNNYQPLTMLLYTLEYNIGHGNSAVFHFVNILLHLLNTCLVFVFVRWISTANISVALITAAFFAVHPMHVESVVWVAEAKDVLYSFFFLLALIKYTEFLRSEKFKSLAFVFAFFVLSCLSKSAAVILPLVLLLIDYYTGRAYSWKMIVEKLPFFAISVVFGIVAIQSQKGAVSNMAPVMSAVEHISIISFTFLSYIFKAIVPYNLSAVYPYPAELGSTLPILYYLSVPGIGVLLFFFCYSLRWGKDVAFGFLFFIITIILVLQIIPVGAAAMADRYTYIPFIGLFFMLGKLYGFLSVNPKAKFKHYSNYLLIAMIAGFVAFTVISYNRVQKWETDVSLFTDAKGKYPYSTIPSFIIGDYYLLNYRSIQDNETKNDNLAKARAEYENALQLSKLNSDKVKAYYNLGVVKSNQGNLADAVSDFDRTIEIDKNYTRAYINRGNARGALNDFKGALNDLNRAIQLDPANALAISNRGVVKYSMNDFENAIKDYDIAIKLDNKDAKTYNLRGSAKYMLKDYKGALEDYNSAVGLNPKYTDAIKNREMVQSAINSSAK